MMKAAFDPVTLATPFFILTVILEIVLVSDQSGQSGYQLTCCRRVQ